MNPQPPTPSAAAEPFRFLTVEQPFQEPGVYLSDDQTALVARLHAGQERYAPLFAQAPVLLRIAESYLLALQASDATHADFRDSCADVVDLLWQWQPPQLRAVIKAATQDDAGIDHAPTDAASNGEDYIWPPDKQAAARRDGWFLGWNGGRVEIQRHEAASTFESDEDARNHVIRKSREGSPLHQEASLFIGS